MNSVKYLLRMAVTLPVMPLLTRQGKKIRSSVPRLPEASEPSGTTGSGPRTLQLITLGESTMAGIGAARHQDGFAGTLATGLAKQYNATVSWQVYAKSGYTAARLDREILPKIKEEEADLIVIGLGGNDSFRLTPPWSWRRHILQLCENLRHRFGNIPLVFINMPPVREFPAFTPLIRRVAGSHAELLGSTLNRLAEHLPGVYYMAERITLDKWRNQLHYSGKQPEFFSDGVHPAPLAYQIWARETLQFIRQNDVI